MNAVSRYGRLLLAAGMLAAAAAHAQAPPKVGDKLVMPDVQLLDGTRLSAADLAGKPLVVEYWASWCPYCARQNPHLQKLTDAASGKGLRILTVSIDKDEQAARDYIAKHGYTFGVAMDSEALRAVFGKRRVIPEIFVLDANGKLLEAIPGEMFEEDVLELLRHATPRS
ncbi:TlpA family protein disulfide reductase [Achromobacter sp. SD115]|uniref:TlpA family protein disulfide reductase n=1 Tax=Achromobacter sp. SD115 TaxID=2782011 RepID=UPI001A960785|nr:TlpA disulfide reductase family protein [Achromobacter sp. SD115]MBO1018167.1 TlpA family protein disulfide reductase [Achromobacter sp. SD115]